MNKLAIVALTALAASSVWAVEGTLTTKNNDTKKGDITWQARAKKYLVSSKNVSSEYPLADVVKVDVAKPKNLDTCISSKNIAGLKKIVNDYRMLGWDRVAARELMLALVANGKEKEAFEIAEPMIKDDRKAAYTGEMAAAYWQTLLALGEKQKLENCLRLATTEGDRRSSAEALVARGDIFAKAAEGLEGEAKTKANRQALTDGYLRVALMYRDDADADCRAASRAAMIRSAGIFEDIGNNVYAEFMRSEAEKIR